MLFLYRPRQTWMPFGLPRARTEQAAYNRHLQEQFDATRRVPPATPSDAPAPQARDRLAELRELGDLHASGALTDEEFATAKAKVLADPTGAS
jgi:hypothetical protein